MTRKEALKLSGRSETWLRNHECSWCGKTLYAALRGGCGAMGERCDPTKKNFGPDAMERRHRGFDCNNTETPSGDSSPF